MSACDRGFLSPTGDATGLRPVTRAVGRFAITVGRRDQCSPGGLTAMGVVVVDAAVKPASLSGVVKRSRSEVDRSARPSSITLPEDPVRRCPACLPSAAASTSSSPARRPAPTPPPARRRSTAVSREAARRARRAVARAATGSGRGPAPNHVRFSPPPRPAAGFVDEGDSARPKTATCRPATDDPRDPRALLLDDDEDGEVGSVTDSTAM